MTGAAGAADRRVRQPSATTSPFVQDCDLKPGLRTGCDVFSPIMACTRRRSSTATLTVGSARLSGWADRPFGSRARGPGHTWKTRACRWTVVADVLSDDEIPGLGAVLRRERLGDRLSSPSSVICSARPRHDIEPHFDEVAASGGQDARGVLGEVLALRSSGPVLNQIVCRATWRSAA